MSEAALAEIVKLIGDMTEVLLPHNCYFDDRYQGYEVPIKMFGGSVSEAAGGRTITIDNPATFIRYDTSEGNSGYALSVLCLGESRTAETSFVIAYAWKAGMKAPPYPTYPSFVSLHEFVGDRELLSRVTLEEYFEKLPRCDALYKKMFGNLCKARLQ